MYLLERFIRRLMLTDNQYNMDLLSLLTPFPLTADTILVKVMFEYLRE